MASPSPQAWCGSVQDVPRLKAPGCESEEDAAKQVASCCVTLNRSRWGRKESGERAEARCWGEQREGPKEAPSLPAAGSFSQLNRLPDVELFPPEYSEPEPCQPRSGGAPHRPSEMCRTNKGPQVEMRALLRFLVRPVCSPRALERNKASISSPAESSSSLTGPSLESCPRDPPTQPSCSSIASASCTGPSPLLRSITRLIPERPRCS